MEEDKGKNKQGWKNNGGNKIEWMTSRKNIYKKFLYRHIEGELNIQALIPLKLCKMMRKIIVQK